MTRTRNTRRALPGVRGTTIVLCRSRVGSQDYQTVVPRGSVDNIYCVSSALEEAESKTFLIASQKMALVLFPRYDKTRMIINKSEKGARLVIMSERMRIGKGAD